MQAAFSEVSSNFVEPLIRRLARVLPEQPRAVLVFSQVLRNIRLSVFEVIGALRWRAGGELYGFGLNLDLNEKRRRSREAILFSSAVRLCALARAALEKFCTAN
jgi:hypothetical protein